MMTMMIIALKMRKSRFFFNLLIAPRTVSDTYGSTGQGAIACKSRAAHRALVTCNMCTTWSEGTARLFSLTEFIPHPGAIVCRSCATYRALIKCNMLCAETAPGRNRVQIMCNIPSTYHVQHVVCRNRARAQSCANHVQYTEHLSRATCCVPLDTEGQFIY